MSCLIVGNKYYDKNGNESQLYQDLVNIVGETKAKDLFVFAHAKIPQKFSPLVKQGEYGVGTTKISFGDNINPITNKSNGDIELKLITTPQKDRGKGNARRAINEFLAYTDALGKNVVLTVVPRDKTTTEAQLISFYKSVGFVTTPSGFEMIRYKKPSMFTKNGEPKAVKVIELARQQNEKTEPLSHAEKIEVGMMMAQFPNLETSDDLLTELEKAFYRDGLFNPTKQSLSNLYSEFEAENLLSNVTLLNQVKENIEKLKNTDTIENSTVLEADIKTSEINLFGKLKTLNPYIIQQDIIEEFGGVENPDLSEALDKTITEEYLSEFSKIPVIDDNGNPVLDKVVYENATKVFEDISDLTPEKLINHGININNTDVVDSILSNPSISNILSQNDGAPQRQETVKVRTEGRDLVYLETFKNEEQLFNELSLVQTNTPNVYHRIEKVDEQELRSFLNNNESPEYQLYKDYYGYTSPTVEETSVTVSPITTNIEYLKGDFIADFNIEILKNPNHEFYNKFEVNEKGISLKYNDPISISQIKAYISDNIKLGKELSDYSVISKNIPNLKEEAVEDDRITAVNNINSLKKPTSQVTQVDNNTVLVKNESENFINYKNDVYELKNKEGNNSVYTKLNVVKDLNYYQVEVETQEYTEQVKVPQQSLQKYSTINKLYKKSDIEDNFSCVG